MNDCTQELERFAADILTASDTEDAVTVHEILNKLSKLQSDDLKTTNRNLALFILQQGYLI